MLGDLVPINAGGAVLAAQQRIGDTDADDRANQRMRGLEAGRPIHQVPRFHMMAAINRANTIAKPALEPTCRINSTGSSETMPKATAPLEAKHAEQVEAAGPHPRPPAAAASACR